MKYIEILKIISITTEYTGTVGTLVPTGTLVQ